MRGVTTILMATAFFAGVSLVPDAQAFLKKGGKWQDVLKGQIVTVTSSPITQVFDAQKEIMLVKGAIPANMFFVIRQICIDVDLRGAVSVADYEATLKQTRVFASSFGAVPTDGTKACTTYDPGIVLPSRVNSGSPDPTLKCQGNPVGDTLSVTCMATGVFTFGL